MNMIIFVNYKTELKLTPSLLARTQLHFVLEMPQGRKEQYQP